MSNHHVPRCIHSIDTINCKASHYALSNYHVLWCIHNTGASSCMTGHSAMSSHIALSQVTPNYSYKMTLSSTISSSTWLFLGNRDLPASTRNLVSFPSSSSMIISSTPTMNLPFILGYRLSIPLIKAISWLEDSPSTAMICSTLMLYRGNMLSFLVLCTSFEVSMASTFTLVISRMLALLFSLGTVDLCVDDYYETYSRTTYVHSVQQGKPGPIKILPRLYKQKE
ncbi:hypothetical protein FXO38_01199 [Capsicum annuum]|nr:hypothetical protein FXO38_01199 [Capsicum annuum]